MTEDNAILYFNIMKACAGDDDDGCLRKQMCDMAILALRERRDRKNKIAKEQALQDKTGRLKPKNAIHIHQECTEHMWKRNKDGSTDMHNEY